jgi:hypothetical protein
MVIICVSFCNVVMYFYPLDLTKQYALVVCIPSLYSGSPGSSLIPASYIFSEHSWFGSVPLGKCHCGSVIFIGCALMYYNGACSISSASTIAFFSIQMYISARL